MSCPIATELPTQSLLLPYRAEAYTDCYVAQLPFPVSLAEFVEAFCTTRWFQLERRFLGAMLRRPSTDAQARELSLGERESFAVWFVEARDERQALLAAGRRRSWLSVAPHGPTGTMLFFGSAVVPRRSPSGAQSMGFWFWLLGGFHRAYSRALLGAARNRLLVKARNGFSPDGTA